MLNVVFEVTDGQRANPNRTAFGTIDFGPVSFSIHASDARRWYRVRVRGGFKLRRGCDQFSAQYFHTRFGRRHYHIGSLEQLALMIVRFALDTGQIGAVAIITNLRYLFGLVHLAAKDFDPSTCLGREHRSRSAYRAGTA